MEVTLVDGGRIRAMAVPSEGAEFATSEDGKPVCSCGSVSARGLGIVEETFDTYIAPAVCFVCKAPLGELRAKVSTIFGIAEDNAVLYGRARVY